MRAILALAALLVLASLPAHAAPAAHVEPGAWAVWFKSDGASGVSPVKDIVRDADYVVDCAGVSPARNDCTLVDRGCGSWVPRFCAWEVGWEVPPPTDPTNLVGSFVGSTSVVMTGTYDASAKVAGTCDWATASLGNQYMSPTVECTWTHTNADALAGTLTAVFHNAGYDLHALPYVGPGLPATGSLTPPEGSWHAFLLANFAG